MAYSPFVDGEAWMSPDEFVSTCRAKARRNPKLGGRVAEMAALNFELRAYASHVFRDEVIEIVAEAEPMRALLVRDRETGTPVVWVNNQGTIVRYLDEVKSLVEYVKGSELWSVQS